MQLEEYTTVILAGGRGTRISEYSDNIPKPLVPIGGRPIIAHIINTYSSQGVKNFIIAGGYKIDELKRYFAQYNLFNGDFCINTKDNSIKFLTGASADLSISVIDTGLNTQTGGRLKRLERLLGSKSFFLTYGDGVSNVNLTKLLKQHRELAAAATITAVHPSSRYGKVTIQSNGFIASFLEKPEFGEDWINGGYMVMEPSVLRYLSGDDDVLETTLLKKLASDGLLGSHKHKGFWKSMDTLRDKRELDEIASHENLPWLDII